MSTTDARWGGGSRGVLACARCGGDLSVAAGRWHDLAPAEAADWGMPAGAYHEDCCPECNGAGPTVPPFARFDEAAASVVHHLRGRLPLALWKVTRLDGDRAVVVAVEDTAYGMRPGDVLSWPDTVCARMAAGGPRLVPDVRREPAYAAAPLARALPVAAYAGVPLEGRDGSVLGTLVGLHPTPVPAAALDLPLVELLARLLGTVVAELPQPAAPARLRGAR